ncbi:hypothetical protein [Pseudoalteromonas peptidolytica]|uniref:Formyl transferase C-terminal domain-containing protein n=1 Tax=Pseudoalteromonas peptidolytica F12-50-A1 TaxID=1315280 RepID=A0A8I0MW15_9GAMM|nr:hypothetical protein [Pseudoalteromonas peptidolytica]MBE0346422.1 hypothetical protein [Pseudoalteromonas peptidolytica F12-50-A1]NLR14634.1 hypothetical protein [Pseudoalteromonas peptidolytica]GEK09259.1 hypothetical protein PPE03_15080 [Pseudoalteromonas peptidolytica]
MEKVILLASSPAATPAIECLAQMNALAGILSVYCPESVAQQHAAAAQHFDVPHAYHTNLDEDVLASARQTWQGSRFISYHLPYEPLCKLQSAQNIVQVQVAQNSNATVEHAVFHSIYSQQSSCALIAVCVKKQTVLLSHDVTIDSLDTAGTLHKKLIMQLPNLLQQLVNDVDSLEQTTLCRPFAPKSLPTLNEADLFVHLQTDSAEQVVDLVRAANPYFGGARLRIGHAVCQLLQVTISPQPTYGVKAGTIITLSTSGGLVLALTNKQAVKVDVVSSSEGVFDGYRFAMQANLQAGMNLK